MIKRIFAGLIVLLLNFVNPVFANGSLSSLEDLYSEYYSHLKNRDTHFTLYYSGKIADAKALISSMGTRTLVSDPATQVAVTGWQYKQWTRRSTRLEVNVTYSNTKAEEEAVITALKPAMLTLMLDTKTEYEKVLAIHNWILDHVTYDDTLQKYGLKDAWDGSVVCQGYAALFHEMCYIAGIQSKIVYGTVDGGGHAWNLVNVGGNWYHIDCTNDDAHYNKQFYFLKSDESMSRVGSSYEWDKTLWPAAASNYTETADSESNSITIVIDNKFK